MDSPHGSRAFEAARTDPCPVATDPTGLSSGPAPPSFGGRLATSSDRQNLFFRERVRGSNDGANPANPRARLAHRKAFVPLVGAAQPVARVGRDPRTSASTMRARTLWAPRFPRSTGRRVGTLARALVDARVARVEGRVVLMGIPIPHGVRRLSTDSPQSDAASCAGGSERTSRLGGVAGDKNGPHLLLPPTRVPARSDPAQTEESDAIRSYRRRHRSPMAGGWTTHPSPSRGRRSSR
jgi:hypothetical protein